MTLGRPFSHLFTNVDAKDYMSGPQENLRVLQSYEAEYARRVAFASEGFRDPKVLSGPA